MSQNPGTHIKKVTLKKYLQEHKTIPEKKFTHTTMGDPPNSYPGSYCIEDLNEFFDV